MKTTIKKLSKEIEDVLEQNSISNEMAALIDYGEWSGRAPDFTKLINRWNLTRELLLTYLEVAEGYSKKWFENHPKSRDTSTPLEYHNPWYIVCQNIHAIFMTGALNEEP